MDKKSTKFSTNQICSIALFMALVCISTLFFKIPIPLGYAHLGMDSSFLLLFSWEIQGEFSVLELVQH